MNVRKTPVYVSVDTGTFNPPAIFEFYETLHNRDRKASNSQENLSIYF